MLLENPIVLSWPPVGRSDLMLEDPLLSCPCRLLLLLLLQGVLLLEICWLQRWLLMGSLPALLCMQSSMLAWLGCICWKTLLLLPFYCGVEH